MKSSAKSSALRTWHAASPGTDSIPTLLPRTPKPETASRAAKRSFLESFKDPLWMLAIAMGVFAVLAALVTLY